MLYLNSRNGKRIHLGVFNLTLTNVVFELSPEFPLDEPIII